MQSPGQSFCRYKRLRGAPGGQRAVLDSAKRSAVSPDYVFRQAFSAAFFLPAETLFRALAIQHPEKGNSREIRERTRRRNLHLKLCRVSPDRNALSRSAPNMLPPGVLRTLSASGHKRRGVPLEEQAHEGSASGKAGADGVSRKTCLLCPSLPATGLCGVKHTAGMPPSAPEGSAILPSTAISTGQPDCGRSHESFTIPLQAR